MDSDDAEEAAHVTPKVTLAPTLMTNLAEREQLARVVLKAAALAEKERRFISQRTWDALAAKKAQGVRLGGLNAKGIANRDEAMARAEALRPVFAELGGQSSRAIAAELNARGVATPSGGRWHAETVLRVQRRLQRRAHREDGHG